ncbi:hypothetical protein EUX98_g5618 [Antrodiella citrinella]|uniref:ubiquitinyl hydrolase 1 n=1 Tax=Antrodiella citrinella TaxID=2447956 RepID=A0A4V3XIB4_9APHY|nr:hypothetical protein EUX98_g5618 [Antrodiella citrinella]
MDSQPSSSSKRSISVDPSQDPQAAPQPDELASLSMADTTIHADVDAYMAEQGDASTSIILEDDSAQRWQANAATASDLSGEQKLALIDQLGKTSMVEGAIWYLVSRLWARRWRKACSGDVDKDGPVTQAELGPVDNSNLVDNNGILQIPPLEGVDVEYHPEQAWQYLVSWYGQPEYPLARKVITRGIAKQTGLEIMPPRLRIHLLVGGNGPASIQPFVTLSMSTNDTAETFVSTISTLFRAMRTIPTVKPPRIWKLPEHEKIQQLEVSISKLKGAALLDAEGRKTLDELLIDSGDSFVAEFPTENGWLVRDPGASTPQSSTSAAPSKLFEPSSNFFDKMQSSSSTSTALVKSDSTSLGAALSIKPLGMRAKGPKIEPGTLGLANMGNTCFMNSAIQCLVHTRELMDYFLTGVYEDELNPENPLGMHGAIAEAFGALLSRIWDPMSSSTSYPPREFKQVLQKFAPQFGGYQQHDSQELVAFLLDGLHEDLNRVLKKPYVEKPDWEGGGDKELVALARNSWDGYMKRNDSVIVDLFQGQYQSTLVCPECEKVSITFDPFMYLTLPLPFQKKWCHDVFYIPWDADKPHVKIPVELNRDASFKEVRQLLGRWMEVNPDHLVTLEIFSFRFYKDLNDHVAWGDMLDNDIIVCYELPGPAQQIRLNKRQPGDPFVVPVFLSDTLRTTRGYGTNNGAFGYPFLVFISEQDACDQEAMYNIVLSRLERWTENARDLSRWEAGSPADSGDDSLEEVPIPLTNGAPDSTVEITENGDVITVEDVSPEEGDIVDQKGTLLIHEADHDQVAPKLSSPRKVGFKKEIFQLHVNPYNAPFGVGFGTIGPTRGTVSSFESREEESQNLSPPVLLRPYDTFICEFDSHMKSYYFGEHAKWNKFDDFIHPEFEANRAAAKALKNKSISLQDCLDEFTKEEKLGEDDLWYCPRCKKHQQATKRFDLWKVPDILVVHLKRFSNNRTLRDKIDAFVDFPVEGLDLTAMIGERQAAKRLTEEGADMQTFDFGDIDEPLVYDLYAVDEHLGGLGGGHYRAYAQNHTTNQWYHFDDTHVSTSQPEAAVNSNAYLLFYKRRTARPLGGKSHEKIEAARQRPKASSSTAEVALEETQLPTPPSEPLRSLVALPGVEDFDGGGWLSPPGTTSSSASRGSSPPPLDDELPTFEESAEDPLVMSARRYDMPDPSPSLPSPTSSLEAEMDSDDIYHSRVPPGMLHRDGLQWSKRHGTTAGDDGNDSVDIGGTDDEMD